MILLLYKANLEMHFGIFYFVLIEIRFKHWGLLISSSTVFLYLESESEAASVVSDSVRPHGL